MANSVFDTTFQQQNVESKIIVSLERISEAFKVLLWEDSKTHGLTPIQVQILVFCLFHSPDKRKGKQLASELNVTKATISDAVKTLEKKGLISKTIETDARSYIIELTSHGKNIAKNVSFFANPLHSPIERLSEAKKGVLLKSLLDLISNLQSAGIISINRMCLSCKHYEQRQEGHFCHLLQKKLSDQELRIDCSEYVAVPKPYK
ncbi:MAG: MarR family winged helix-turn-helix transcriptional regulator [Cyclobacteriaceae bacterium]